MVDVKSGPVSLSIRQNPEVKIATVVVSFKAKGNSEILRNISCAHNYSFDDPDATALLYALFLNAKDKLFKNFADDSKSKIVGVNCALQCDMFSIYAECDASVTCVRKTIAGILLGLNPARCRATYKDVVRAMGVSPNDDCFNHCCNALEAGLKSVSVFVGGRALGSKSGDKSVASDMLDIAVKKFDPEFCDKGAARNIKANEKMPKFEDSHYISKKTSSYSALVAAYMFVDTDVPGVAAIDCCITAPKTYETKISKVADKKELLQKQLEKMGKLAEPSHSLAFNGAHHALLNAQELKGLADEKFSAAAIAGGAVKMF
jgi:hypothetical protein